MEKDSTQSVSKSDTTRNYHRDTIGDGESECPVCCELSANERQLPEIGCGCCCCCCCVDAFDWNQFGSAATLQLLFMFLLLLLTTTTTKAPSRLVAWTVTVD